MIGLVPLQGNKGTRASSLYPVQVQEGISLKTRKRTLSKNQFGWYFDLGLPRFQNCKKKMFCCLSPMCFFFFNFFMYFIAANLRHISTYNRSCSKPGSALSVVALFKQAPLPFWNCIFFRIILMPTIK